jgi:hypothetical protein
METPRIGVIAGTADRATIEHPIPKRPVSRPKSSRSKPQEDTEYIACSADRRRVGFYLADGALKPPLPRPRPAEGAIR